MTIFPFPHPPPRGAFTNFQSLTEWLSKFYDGFRVIRIGKMDCVTQFTLDANEDSTVFEDVRLSPQSVLTFDPMTANAAAELAAGTMYALEADRGNGVWTITHANTADADRKFAVSILG